MRKNSNNDSSNLDYYQLKGQDGEKEVKSTLNKIIEANKLILFNNVFLKYGNVLVQIDHVIVSDSCFFFFCYWNKKLRYSYLC